MMKAGTESEESSNSQPESHIRRSRRSIGQFRHLRSTSLYMLKASSTENLHDKPSTAQTFRYVLPFPDIVLIVCHYINLHSMNVVNIIRVDFSTIDDV